MKEVCRMEKYKHVGVYGVLEEDNKVLLIKKSRGPHKGKWDLPGGTIEFGEEPYEALKREFLEETGISEIEATIRSAKSYTIIYFFKENELEEMHHIGIIYTVKVINHQYDLKIHGDYEDSLGAEWISINDLANIETTPFVKEIYLRVKESP